MRSIEARKPARTAAGTKRANRQRVAFTFTKPEAADLLSATVLTAAEISLPQSVVNRPCERLCRATPVRCWSGVCLLNYRIAKEDRNGDWIFLT